MPFKAGRSTSSRSLLGQIVYPFTYRADTVGLLILLLLLQLGAHLASILAVGSLVQGAGDGHGGSDGSCGGAQAPHPQQPQRHVSSCHRRRQAVSCRLAQPSNGADCLCCHATPVRWQPEAKRWEPSLRCMMPVGNLPMRHWQGPQFVLQLGPRAAAITVLHTAGSAITAEHSNSFAR